MLQFMTVELQIADFCKVYKIWPHANIKKLSLTLRACNSQMHVVILWYAGLQDSLYYYKNHVLSRRDHGAICMHEKMCFLSS